jgi:hypothetical protein
MNKIVPFLFVIVLPSMFFTCDTASSISPIYNDVVVKFYGANGNQIAADFEVMSDGGFVIVGTTRELGADDIPQEGALIIRTDAIGNVLWEQRIFENSWVQGNSVVVDAQGNIVVGATTGMEDGRYFLMMAKLSAAGSLVAGPVTYDNLQEIEITTGSEEPTTLSVEGSKLVLMEGGSSFAGYYFSGTGYYGTTRSDFYCLKTDFNLVPEADSLRWRRRNGYENSDRGVGVLPFGENMVVFGDIGQTNGGRNFFYFMLNENGLPASVAQPPQAISRQAAQARLGHNQSELLFIGTETGAANRIYIQILESNAQVPKTIGYAGSGNLVGKSITPHQPGMYVVLGEQITVTNRNIYLAKFFNQGGNALIEWERVYGGAEIDEAKKIMSLPDGGLAVLGTFRVGRQTKMGLLKMNSEGLFVP